MLNFKSTNEALDRLKKEVTSYETVSVEVSSAAQILFDLRVNASFTVLVPCERYLSDLKNAPVDLERAIGELRFEFVSFHQSVNSLEAEAKNLTIQTGGTAVAGGLAGVGVAAFAPAAGMAIATAFGTASTGTAISALSGAAATNAALAWLGGGALAAGGGGMSAGGALLALAGPVGWAIGGTCLIGAGGYAWYRQVQIAEDANQKTSAVHKEVLILDRAHHEITSLIDQTRQFESDIIDFLKELRTSAPDDYNLFTDEDKLHVGSLINNCRSFGEIMRRKIEIKAE
jgi:hypothetical protein